MFASKVSWALFLFSHFSVNHFLIFFLKILLYSGYKDSVLGFYVAGRSLTAKFQLKKKSFALSFLVSLTKTRAEILVITVYFLISTRSLYYSLLLFLSPFPSLQFHFALFDNFFILN